MPYITKGRREMYDCEGIPVPETGGDLQFLIAHMIDELLIERKLDKGIIRYADLEEILGALAGAKSEFYRLVVSKYEEKKMKDNGPVYSTELYL